MEKLARDASLAGRALEMIRTEILSGRLPAGTLVSASTLAEQIGVSRTPVRDALLQLAQAGMVRMEKNRGAVVLATSITDLVEVFQVRLLLEVPLAARAAQHGSDAQLRAIRACLDAMQDEVDDVDRLLELDRDLHLAIATAAGNERARGVLLDLRNVVLTRRVGTLPTTRSPQELVDDHRDFVDAIERRDAAAAADGMARHLEHTVRMLVAQEADGDVERDETWVDAQLAWLPSR